MEDWNVSTPIQINVSGHDAATLGGLPGSFYLTASNLSGVLNSSTIPNLDASKITTGTFSDARLSGSYSGIVSLIRPGTTNGLFLRGGDETLGSGAVIHLYGKDFLGGQTYLDTAAVNFRSLNGNILYGFINANGLSINASTASTSTTTGAITVAGGVGVQGAVVATLLFGELQLKTYTDATEPTATAGNVGKVWLNTDTGNIKFVANSTTIKTLTAV